MRWMLILSICFTMIVQPGAFAITVVSVWHVFFQASTADMNPNDENTLKMVAGAYQALGLAENQLIVIHANTDSAEASDALAQARGEHVRQRLVELGIPFEKIVVFARGDGRRPLVRTPPGTPEAQNRYVEIQIFTPPAQVR